MKKILILITIIPIISCQPSMRKRDEAIFKLLKEDYLFKRHIAFQYSYGIESYLISDSGLKYVKLFYNIQKSALEKVDSFKLNTNNQCLMDSIQLGFLRVSRLYGQKHPDTVPKEIVYNTAKDSMDLYLMTNIYLSRLIILQEQIIECMPNHCY